jgi:4-carboxymuconolactone decarboxylase
LGIPWDFVLRDERVGRAPLHEPANARTEPNRDVDDPVPHAATVSERYTRGRQLLDIVDDGSAARFVEAHGDLGREIVEFVFGGIYSRPGLSLRDRELITVAMLAAIRGSEPELKFHMSAALNVGLTIEELQEVVIQVAPYAGFPAAINAMRLLRSVEASPERRRSTSGQ